MLDSRRFTNESYASMPIAARHLQDGMVNIADDQGRLKANPIYLRNEIFPYDDVQTEQIQVWLNLMVTNETIMLYQANGRDYVQFNNWWAYQSLTFARPSDYPSPEGWEDRICVNGKSNIPLTHNWSKADGTRVKDTCDALGKPLPFVAEIIAGKKAETNERRQTKRTKEEPTPEVYTQAYTQAYTSEYTQVNQQQQEDQTKQKSNKIKINNNMLADFARKEAEFVDGFVGVDAFISTLDSKRLRVFIEWMWLYNNIYAADAVDSHHFLSRYKQDPFKGIDNPPGYIRAQTNEGVYPYVHEVHKKDLEKELQDAAHTFAALSTSLAAAP
jgi:hypothetical protein